MKIVPTAHIYEEKAHDYPHFFSLCNQFSLMKPLPVSWMIHRTIRWIKHSIMARKTSSNTLSSSRNETIRLQNADHTPAFPLMHDSATPRLFVLMKTA